MKTHEEILKSLQCCGVGGTGCSKLCAYYKDNSDCMKNRNNDLIQLIQSIDILKETGQEMYEEGMKKAWDMANKIAFIDKNGGFTCKEFNEIFGNKNKGEVFEMNPMTVAAMIEDWEQTKEYHVGDIVKYNDVLDMMQNPGEKGVILKIDRQDKKVATVLWNSKDFGTYPLEELILTGENVDILPMFEKLNNA